MIFRLALIIFLICLVSCQSPPAREDLAYAELPEFPYEIYQAASAGEVYEIDQEKSRVDILVRRGGTLAHLGHNHVISSAQISGYILLNEKNLAESRADLRVDLTSLLVDEPVSREKYQLDSKPSAEDINKTRINMQDKVLETQTWPLVHLSVDVLDSSATELSANLTISLHGVRGSIPVSINVAGLHSDRIVATGTLDMLQSNFGIEPLSALGGGLKVLDRLELLYSLEASRIQRD